MYRHRRLQCNLHLRLLLAEFLPLAHSVLDHQHCLSLRPRQHLPARLPLPTTTWLRPNHRCSALAQQLCLPAQRLMYFRRLATHRTILAQPTYPLHIVMILHRSTVLVPFHRRRTTEDLQLHLPARSIMDHSSVIPRHTMPDLPRRLTIAL